MNKTSILNALWIVPVVLFTAFVINSIAVRDASSLTLSSAYPPPPTTAYRSAYPPPSVSPTPITPMLPKQSDAARKALEYIAHRDSVPVQSLIIQDDHPTVYPSLGRKFQVVTLLNTRPDGQVYKLLVDLETGKVEEDVVALLEAEAQAHQSRYGKLHPALHKRLQEIGDNDSLPVAIWVAPKPQNTLAALQEAASATLAARYPEVRTAMKRSGKPMDVDDPELARQIEAEYIALVDHAMGERIQPLTTELEQRHFTVIAYEGMPSFTVVLPKSVILELSRRDDVDSIDLVEAKKQLGMDSVVPTDRVPAVWGRGYTGSGVTIAILDVGNVDPSNTFLHLSSTSRPGINGIFGHATETAGVAASFHDTYRGVAYGATILSVGEDSSQADDILALQWAFDQGVPILNDSGGFEEEDANMQWVDRAYDYWTRARFRLVAQAAGNSGGYLLSPGKAWNLLTVGAIRDNNNGNWSGDRMSSSSAYINPVSANSDREKPEVVAVGEGVTVLSNNNAVVTEEGTSYAAPQVAGLAALLIHRNSSLSTWPEAQRAIIMASATHNIEGPSIIVRGQGDLKDGAGALNADLADRAAQLRGTSTGTSYSSCWWGDYISNSDFPVGTELVRKFYVPSTNLV